MLKHAVWSTQLGWIGYRATSSDGGQICKGNAAPPRCGTVREEIKFSYSGLQQDRDGALWSEAYATENYF
jgi:hypothetical protein